MLEAARATCDYYLEETAQDGVPYWDTAAPQLVRLGDWGGKPSDPFNDFEPVDSSAASIAAQGLWRLGSYLRERQEDAERGARYRQAALTIALDSTRRALSFHRTPTSGVDSAFRVSSPERLGLRSPRL